MGFETREKIEMGHLNTMAIKNQYQTFKLENKPKPPPLSDSFHMKNLLNWQYYIINCLFQSDNAINHVQRSIIEICKNVCNSFYSKRVKLLNAVSTDSVNIVSLMPHWTCSSRQWRKTHEIMEGSFGCCFLCVHANNT